MTHENSQLIDFLKSPDTNARISVGNDKWLYWECTNSLTNEGQWVVQYRPFHAKNNRCLYSGDNLSEALEALQER